MVRVVAGFGEGVTVGSAWAVCESWTANVCTARVARLSRSGVGAGVSVLQAVKSSDISTSLQKIKDILNFIFISPFYSDPLNSIIVVIAR